MDIQQALTMPSLRSAKIIAGWNGLSNSVSGIMVLEAADIETWGRADEIILTSYFAMKDLSEKETEQFFRKLSEIGISAIILKIERLLAEIPQSVIAYCNRYRIPLIQIPKEIKYEAVILDILGPIVDANLSLLNRYYEVHNELTKLALMEPSTQQMLHKLKSMICRNLTLVNATKQTKTGTSSKCDHFHIQSSTLLHATKYMNYQYYTNEVWYAHTGPEKRFSQIGVRVPNPGKDVYDLIIHLQGRKLGSEDFMVIENAVSFLQMELLRKHSVEQNLFHRSNSLINDLLNGRIYEQSKNDEVLDLMHLNRAPCYRILIIQLIPNQSNTLHNFDWAAEMIYAIRTRLKKKWTNVAYMEKEDRITFIHNYNYAQESFTPQSIREVLDDIKKTPGFLPFHFQAAISNTARKNEIPKINKEALDVQKILFLFHKHDTILSYDDLGIYKIFLSANQLENLEQFIPAELLQFKKNHPDLMDTLQCFLDANQNLAETAKKLYLHPKTIRYRVDKIRELLHFDFKDAEKVLQMQIFSRILKLIN